MSTNKKAIVVLSGGQDSTTCLFFAKQQGFEIHAITFDYGQRHRLEIQAAERVAKLAGVASHEVLTLPNLLESSSPLTSDNELEKYESYTQMDLVIGDRVEKTFVPMRNTLFLTIAANRAVARGCDTIFTGVCQEDNANYPDCTAEFISTLEETFRVSLRNPTISIVAPLIYMSKRQSVEFASKIPGCMTALAFSHTSYDGKFPPTDMNHSNVLRAQGFLEANKPDPLVVRAFAIGAMNLPDTANYNCDLTSLASEIGVIMADYQWFD